MAKLLIVDDEEKIRHLITKYALFQGHEVFEAATGEDALHQCQAQSFDLIIMDVMMPGMDGFETVRRHRQEENTPILMLSARGETYDRIQGFESGVDDYVVKPFSPRELMLRIEAILKRSQKKPTFDNVTYVKEGLAIDFSARKVQVDGEDIVLSPKETELLFFLIRHRNIALSRETLITEVWDYQYCGDDRTLDTHIKLLRKALGPYARFITTLRGVGYRFDG